MVNINLSVPVFCLMGPTASGKTGIACELVQQFPMEIISIDSAMIYREFNIGAAKPNAEVLAKAPHHLIDILDPPQSYSAAQCCEDVNHLMQVIVQRGNIPLLVGGTMMYFNALQRGLSSLPEANEHIRAEILKEAEEYGWDYLHQQLKLIDPISAARIHPHDTQRLQRAHEVYRIMHIPMSQLWAESLHHSTTHFVNLALIPENRAWLHQRIAERFQSMLAEGFVEEVKQLIEKWHLTASHPAMRCVGYRQIFHYLQEEYDANILLEKGIAATRQLAKRQLTWLRHWSDKTVFIAEDPEVEKKIIAFVKDKISYNRVC